MLSGSRSNQIGGEGFALVARLKACTKQKDLLKGSQVHAGILEKGLLKTNIFVGNTLVNMYVKCGALPEAQQVFHELANRDVVSWNTLAAGYTQHGHPEIAIDCLDRMQLEGLSPDEVTFACILKACGNIRAVQKGQKLHARMLKSLANPQAADKGKKSQVKSMKKVFVENSAALESALLDMYAKCGALASTQQVFDELSARDIVSWTALISGYCEQGLGEKAIDCFDQMQGEGISPDAMAFTCILKACGRIGAVEKGQEVHAEIMRQNLLGKDSILGSALVDMYAKCGLLVMARQVFDTLLVQDVFSWTALLGGYCLHDQNEEALNFFDSTKHRNFSLDSITFACMLKACGKIGDLERGEDLHAEIARKGLLGKATVLEGALLDMYMKCGALLKAQQVFEEFGMQDLVSWTVLIAGYCEHGFHEKALNCFKQMQGEGVFADSVTLAGILKLCGTIQEIEVAKEIHTEIARRQCLAKDVVLGSALIDMYAKCGVLASAQQVFDTLLVRDMVCWTLLMFGYCDHGHGEKAFECFEQMKQEGLSPNVVTFACMLKACGKIGAAERGKALCVEISGKMLSANSIVLGNAVIDMHAKCGAYAKAKQVFEALPARDAVSWNGMIARSFENEVAEESINLYEGMKCEGQSPNFLTFACILKACGRLGAVEKGKEVHTDMVKKGLIENAVLGNALVDMYAKCCAIAKAHQVFGKLVVRDVVSWNSLMNGYCQHGHSMQVFDCLKTMKEDGISPDAVTFACILKTSGSIGAATKSQMCYEIMRATYGIVPTVEHDTCLVRLLGHIGLFDKAVSVVQKIRLIDHLPTWLALLDACRNWGNMKLGRLIFEHVAGLNQAECYP